MEPPAVVVCWVLIVLRASNFLSLLLEAVESDSGPSAPRLAEPASHMDGCVSSALMIYGAVHLVVLLLSRRPREAVGDYSGASLGVDVSRPLVGSPRVFVGAVPFVGGRSR